jgi:hypothetical protein
MLIAYPFAHLPLGERGAATERDERKPGGGDRLFFLVFRQMSERKEAAPRTRLPNPMRIRRSPPSASGISPSLHLLGCDH